MMFLRLLELWTVSAGILLAVWYILLSNTTGGVYLSSFSFLYLLMSWYFESRSSKKSLDRCERSIGLWCSLLLPLVSMLSSKEDDHFLPLTVSIVFVHYAWTNLNSIHLMKYPTTVLLLVQVGVSLTLGASVTLIVFIPMFYVLYGATQRHLSQSFTVGEGAIVSQLLTHFGYKITEATIQHVLGKHTEVIDKTIAVIFFSVAIATTLFVYLQLKRKNPLIFYMIFGLVVAFIVLPSLVLIIKWDGMKSLIGVVFKNKKAIGLFLWWICCSVMSIYIVMFYGRQSSTSNLPAPETSPSSSEYSVKEHDDLMINTSDTDHSELSHDQKTLPPQCVTMATSHGTTTDSLSCRLRKTDIRHEEGVIDIKSNANNSSDQFSSAKQTANERCSKESNSMTLFTYRSRVRKLFHLVMIGVYVPGLMLNTSALYLASVAALAVLVVLELVRVYHVPPLGTILEQHFFVFLDQQDSGGLILTPVYLLIGCSLPLWFSHSINGHADLKVYAGIISIGVGDATASLVGQRFGKHRWPSSKKTVEGTLGAVAFQLLAILILQILRIPGSSLSAVTLISVILISCLEAFSGHIDNLVVSVYAFMLFSTAGTFI